MIVSSSLLDLCANNKMAKSITLLLVLAVLLVIQPVPTFSWKRHAREKKKSKKGWRRTKKGLIRDDLPSDSQLRVGVTLRPEECL